MAKDNQLRKVLDKASPYEVFSLALAMERGAAKQYALLAKRAERRLTKAKLLYLAEEERDHARRIGAMRAGLEVPESPRRLTLPELTEVKGYPETDSLRSALELALGMEHQSEALYNHCAERTKSAAARRLFEALAAQEVRHAALLREELNLVAGPYAESSLEGTPPVEEDFWTL